MLFDILSSATVKLGRVIIGASALESKLRERKPLYNLNRLDYFIGVRSCSSEVGWIYQLKSFADTSAPWETKVLMKPVLRWRRCSRFSSGQPNGRSRTWLYQAWFSDLKSSTILNYWRKSTLSESFSPNQLAHLHDIRPEAPGTADHAASWSRS